MKHKSAFTLIEILVVISILAGFVTMLVPNFMAARIKARDSKRKSDLKQIQKALELYRQNQVPQIYPATLPVACGSWKSTDLTTTYMGVVPGDPSTSCPTQTSYHYVINPTDSMRYDLYACLEDKADPDKTNCPTSGYTCSTGQTYCYKLSEP